MTELVKRTCILGMLVKINFVTAGKVPQQKIVYVANQYFILLRIYFSEEL